MSPIVQKLANLIQTFPWGENKTSLGILTFLGTTKENKTFLTDHMIKTPHSTFTSLSIGQGQIKKIEEHLKKQKEHFNQLILITDNTLNTLYKKSHIDKLAKYGTRFLKIILDEGEKNKNLSSVQKLWQTFFSNDINRKSLVIVMGGGALCDLVGFAASCYMRGISFIYLPTTLLAMVDASIGGKTGVNTHYGKNTLGVFSLPQKTFIDPSFTLSLPNHEFKNGLAEVIKYGFIHSPDIIESLYLNQDKIVKKDLIFLEKLITKCCYIKCLYIDSDFKENYKRQELNWGHTFAHALENLLAYQKITHGQAVSIGMSCAAHLSYILGEVPQSFIDQQESICKLFKLPTQLPQEVSIEEIIQVMKRDKKCDNQQITCIVSKGIGKVFIKKNTPYDMIYQALKHKKHVEKSDRKHTFAHS